ncbi:MAG: hypothetical protein ACREIP_06645 [Alphaproteobacteria bacterium]
MRFIRPAARFALVAILLNAASAAVAQDDHRHRDGLIPAQISGPNVDRPIYPGGEVNANPAQLGPELPRDDVVEAMLKNALMTFNDANISGNYQVFHARLHPAFRAQRSAADLANIFVGFRTSRIDLAPLLVHRPIYAEPPAIDGDGNLSLKGYFETRPWRTSYNVLWRRDGNAWQLWRINVQARPPEQ